MGWELMRMKRLLKPAGMSSGLIRQDIHWRRLIPESKPVITLLGKEYAYDQTRI